MIQQCPAPDELRDAYINDADAANNSDEDNFPVPVLAEPKDLRIATFRPRQALESTDERPSNSESHPVLHAVNSRDSGDSSGGEVSLYSLPKPPEPLPFWMWPQPKQLTDQSPFQ